MIGFCPFVRRGNCSEGTRHREENSERVHRSKENRGRGRKRKGKEKGGCEGLCSGLKKEPRVAGLEA